MEKLIYALWAPQNTRRTDYVCHLLARLPAMLKALGATGIRVNVRDAAVEPATPLIQQWQMPQQDAVVQLWLPSANRLFREPIDLLLRSMSAQSEAWLVTESSIIANQACPPARDHRTCGWSQASFISFRSDLPRSQAVRHWHDHHTRVAIDTQSNFEYIQNLIVMPLSEAAPTYDGFVEECFPLAAMTDQELFFDAVNDEARLARNREEMARSCAEFIDFSRIDIIPTSQFDFRHLDTPSGKTEN